MSADRFPPSGKGEVAWPTSRQYNEAVQNLRNSMCDEQLQGGKPAVNNRGLPLLYSGGFADVYQVHCPADGNMANFPDWNRNSNRPSRKSIHTIRAPHSFAKKSPKTKLPRSSHAGRGSL